MNELPIYMYLMITHNWDSSTVSGKFYCVSKLQTIFEIPTVRKSLPNTMHVKNNFRQYEFFI